MWYLFILLQGSGVSGSWDPYPYPSEQVCVSSAKKVQKDVERDYFMTADEALAYGIIDEIIPAKDAK